MGTAEQPSLDMLLQMHERAALELAEMQAHVEALKAKIVEELEILGEKRFEAPSSFGNKNYRATYSRSEKVSLDAAGLYADLDYPTYVSICEAPKVSKEKLNDAIESGSIPAELAARHIKVDRGRPTVRFFLVDEQKETDDPDSGS